MPSKRAKKAVEPDESTNTLPLKYKKKCELLCNFK